jgi:hypothetical protein
MSDPREVYCYRTMRGQLVLLSCKGRGEPLLVPPGERPKDVAERNGCKLVYQIGTPAEPDRTLQK